MRYLRGEVLGLFCGELGICPSSRVAVAHSRQGLLVWDLTVGLEFHVNFTNNALITEHKPAPERCYAIFQETDNSLLTRIGDPNLMPWSEERETLISELRYRGVRYPKRPRYPIRRMLASLFAPLTVRLNPFAPSARPAATHPPVADPEANRQPIFTAQQP